MYIQLYKIYIRKYSIQQNMLYFYLKNYDYNLYIGLFGEKGDTGFPGIGLPGYVGQKVNLFEII